MSAYDLTDQLIKSDYFLDVNPRNLRRLVNIIALTGRLLRAYHIDFNWRLLASWIYLNEQWPYRCSWIIMQYEEHETEFNEETPLNEIYNQIKNHIPVSNEPLLELDRNPRKFEQFLLHCKPELTVSILKKILPCTCNLDPYLIKLIKDAIENAGTHDKLNIASNLIHTSNSNQAFQTYTPFSNNTLLNNSLDQNNLAVEDAINSQLFKRRDFTLPTNASQANEDYLQIDMMAKPLCEMSVADLSEAIDSNAIDSLSDDFKQIYKAALKDSNINGKVLSFCNLDELKLELKMTFGDWQMFKNWVQTKRFEQQKLSLRKNFKSVTSTSIPSKVNTPDVTKPETPTPTTAMLSQSHRKVEFVVTPVIEIDEHVSFMISKTSPKSVLSNSNLEHLLKDCDGYTWYEDPVNLFLSDTTNCTVNLCAYAF